MTNQYVHLSEVNELIKLYSEREAVLDHVYRHEELTTMIHIKIKNIRENAEVKEMNLNEYQELSKRTMPKYNDPEDKITALNNYGLGLCGESGEVADLIKKKVHHLHNSIDTDDFKKELGDVLHYLSGLATIFDISLEEVATANIQKLKDRYPTGFNPGDSMKRVDTKK